MAATATRIYVVTNDAVDFLPAVSVRMDGALTVHSNLPAFGEALRTFVAKIPKAPATDQQFADTEAACKSLKKAEEALEAAEAGALASVADVEAMRRMVADICTLARSTRLASEKMVEARKLAIRVEIVNAAQAKLDEHQRALNDRLGAAWVPRTVGGFGDAIKGKKTVASCEDAVSVALANARIDMSALADRLEVNRKALIVNGKDWWFMFADFASLGAKPVEDFAAVAQQRIQKHIDAEAAEAKRKADSVAAEMQRKLHDQAAEEARRAAFVPASMHQQTAQRIPIPPAPSSEVGTLNAAYICKRLGFVLTVEFITSTLGIAPVSTERRATLWTERQFDEICSALIRHIVAAKVNETAEPQAAPVEPAGVHVEAAPLVDQATT